MLNRDNAQYARLAAAAKAAGVERIVSFGENAKADARLLRVSLQADSSTVEARILGEPVTYKLGAPGRHLVLNSLAVLAAAVLVGADLALAALALDELKPAAGRGARVALQRAGRQRAADRRELQRQSGLDAAAIALLGQAPIGPQRPAHRRARRHAGTGPAGAELHRALAEPLKAASVDLVFCAGPLMRALWEALPSGRRGGYAETAAALEPAVLDAIRAGDAVMVKGSLGSKMGPIVKALERQFPKAGTRAPTP